MEQCRPGHAARHRHKAGTYMNKIIDSCMSSLKLNMKIAALALANKWMKSSDIGSSYDKISSSYDVPWQRQLRLVTDELIETLPQDICKGNILDLGCGLGHASGVLADKYPGMKISAIDISLGMLLHARKSCYRKKNVFFIKSDMLDYMRHEETQSASLVFSAWSAGYSKPARLIKEARRILRKGGNLAVVTSLSDSFTPLFEAYKNCMSKYPGKVNLALWRDFPEHPDELKETLEKYGFCIETFETKTIDVKITRDSAGNCLPWLMKTGILAGFDKVLRFGTESELSRYFEEQVKSMTEPMKHNYVLFRAVI